MNYLELSKKELQEGGTVEALNIVEEGREDTLAAYLYAMSQVEYYTAFAKGLHESAMSEFENYGEKEIELRGRKISKSEFGVKYDFSNCGHIHIDALENTIKREQEVLKHLESQIKAMQSPQTFIDEESGEAFTVKPPIKTSTTKLKLTY